MARGSSGCKFKAVLIDQVEALVEEEYERLQADLNPAWIVKLREVLSTDMETFRTHVQFEVAQQTKRIDRLKIERKKLLQAHYADSIPFELFREEQARISREVGDAEDRLAAVRKSPEHSMQEMLDALIDLVRTCYQTYLNATPSVRRLFNQAFFERLEVAEDGQELTLSRLAAPIDLIVRPEQVELDEQEKTPSVARGGQRRGGSDTDMVGGLNKNYLVALAVRLSSPSPQVRKLLDRLADRSTKLSSHSTEHAFECQQRQDSSSPKVLKVQHRLAADAVNQLIADYRAGATVPQLADRFDVNCTTVSAHLERHGVPRRAHRRKLTDEQIAEAAKLYAAGWSTAKVGKHFIVSAETALQTLRKAGVSIRPRPGRSSSGS